MANTPIKLPNVLTVKQLADAINQPVTAVIGKLMGFGVLATINEDIDFDTAAIVADDFGVIVDRIGEETREDVVLDNTKELSLRPAIVTIMGHVDHGKTTLLDTIRKTNVAAKEAGGITQHISSYQIEITPKDSDEKRKITFLDTPGHSAFEAMRRHGARITDLVVLVVAADDGVKPQTVEAIKHAKQWKVPIMVAINKIDKPEADIDKVKAELAEFDLVAEDWGGSTVMCQISAKQNIGIPDLLNMIFLATDIRELKANFDVPGTGVVVESHVKPGIGPVATILVQNGTIHVGDYVAIGAVHGRVRTLTDYRGKKQDAAPPATPIEISGLTATPQFGEQLVVVDSERVARDSASTHVRAQSAKRATSALSSSAQSATKKEGNKNILYLIIKADTKGSMEAIRDTLNTYKNEDVEVRVVSDGIGDISEGDITMANTANALILGFNIRVSSPVKQLADRQKVSISMYSVIYELFDNVREVLADLMPEVEIERVTGEVKILARFRDNKKHIVVGGSVEVGLAQPKVQAKIMRGSEELARGMVVVVKRGKDESKSVQTGSECGIELNLTGETAGIDKGDTLVMFTVDKEKKSLVI